jgi:hypothetical protein
MNLRHPEACGALFAAASFAYASKMRARIAAIFFSAAFADDCDNWPARRAKFFDLVQNDPLMMAMLAGQMGGPENAPPEAFDGHLTELIRAA